MPVVNISSSQSSRERTDYPSEHMQSEFLTQFMVASPYRPYSFSATTGEWDEELERHPSTGQFQLDYFPMLGQCLSTVLMLTWAEEGITPDDLRNALASFNACLVTGATAELEGFMQLATIASDERLWRFLAPMSDFGPLVTIPNFGSRF